MMDVMDWPDDTLELMRREAGPWPPLKIAVEPQLPVQVRYPVTVPVLTDDVELYCDRCGLWNDVADWEQAGAAAIAAWGPGSAARCPDCYALPAEGHEHGDYERRATGLFTVVLPVPPRHHHIAFDPDLQARNALAACRLAREHARKAGLEPA